MEAPDVFQLYLIHGADCDWRAKNHTGSKWATAWEFKLPSHPLGEWHRLEIATIGNEISFYIDGELQFQTNDDLHPSGGVMLFAYDSITEFDNVIITGDDIPNVGPSGYAVEPEAKLATTWGAIKR